ncbi:MAG TPA: putative O-glycosylation ligase, exosortase A system-associated [Rhizomicrobium sp.]|nr:putative O-glycosylation ligase, exosortase A system-associated [Rhizomicrobium sp.]
MRDLFLVAAVAISLGFTLRYPFVGVLIWEWFALMAPHQEAFGFVRSLPLNLIVAGTAVLSWVLSEEPKKIPRNSLTALFLVFLVWMTFNSFFAFNPAWSWIYWDRTWRVFALGFLIAATATNRARIDAIIWVAAISLMYYGVKGGIFTVMTGGVYRVYGPDATIISDNNQLALAVLMAMPLIEYLRSTTTSKFLKLLLAACMVSCVIAVLGSYSRGAYIAMAAIAGFFLLHVRQRLMYLLMGSVVLYFTLQFMPQSFFDRIDTLHSLKTDGSFQGRWVAWQVAIMYATEHFPFGAGFYGPQLHAIFNHYFPGQEAHAAHSIYFQVLGEHGFIGLGIYLAIILAIFKYCWSITRRTKRMKDLWQHRLARMIQTSLLAFFVGGAALSMAYYDLFVVLALLLPQIAALLPAAAVAGAKWRAEGKSDADLPPAASPAFLRSLNS